MFNWFKRQDTKKLEEKTEQSFSAVKKDMDSVGKWIKHLDSKNKQLFDLFNELKIDLSSVKDEIDGLHEALTIVEETQKNKQLFEKTPVFEKQTAVEAVEEAVQTPVQTANFNDILKRLSSNQRLLIFTLLNSDMKLSYEDLAMMLGKERSTIRGQVNMIRQKHEGLIEEMTERSGKKRVYLPEEVKEKLSKYAKVRVKKEKKVRVNEENEEKVEENA